MSLSLTNPFSTFSSTATGGISVGSLPKASAGATSPETATKPDPVKEFMDYMKKPLAERMQEAWLKQHGMTKEEFDALPPEEKDAITKQMAEDIKKKLEEEARKNQPGTLINALV